MSTIIIQSNPDIKRKVSDNSDFIKITEFFCDTIQGEGINIGCPATFIRLQGCTLNCTWCDSDTAKRIGNPYTFKALFTLMEEIHLIDKFRLGQHLIFTGGSPLLQQEKISRFLQMFRERYEFLPYIEIENECVIEPNDFLKLVVDCWNNSPKLSSSGNIDVLRYKSNIIRYTSMLHNSWFKFVVSGDGDWREIERDFLNKKLIKRSQIILMPLGASREELGKSREKVIEIAIREGVRYSSREHITVWDKELYV